MATKTATKIATKTATKTATKIAMENTAAKRATMTEEVETNEVAASVELVKNVRRPGAGRVPGATTFQDVNSGYLNTLLGGGNQTIKVSRIWLQKEITKKALAEAMAALAPVEDMEVETEVEAEAEAEAEVTEAPKVKPEGLSEPSIH